MFSVHLLVDKHVHRATVAAACDFEDPTWAVPTSSMMVFALQERYLLVTSPNVWLCDSSLTKISDLFRHLFVSIFVFVDTHVHQATMAAVCGFEAPTWAVRNSSMMVFASIMQRAVGGAKNSAPADPC